MTALDPLVFDEGVRTWGAPSTKETDTATFTIWRTLDNEYMVVRVVSKMSDDHRFNAYRNEACKQFLGGCGSKEAWEAAGKPKKIVRHDIPIHVQDNGRPKDYGTLYKAMEVVAEYHQEKHSPDSVKNNDAAIEALATEAGLATLPRNVPGAAVGRSRGPAVELDQYGARVGSGGAKVNAVLSTTPKKMDQLIKEAGVSGTYYQHLKAMIQAGLVVKTAAGFALAQKGTDKK
jgi:hypothetical protein